MPEPEFENIYGAQTSIPRNILPVYVASGPQFIGINSWAGYLKVDGKEK
jgi:hypothetical protein